MVADTAVTAFPDPGAGITPTFHFRVIDNLSGEALLGTSISSRKQHRGTTTDITGKASLTYLLPVRDTIEVQYIGYNRVAILLQDSSSTFFTVRLGPPYYFAAGDTLVFQLKDVRPNSFAYRQRFNITEIADDEIPYSHCERISATAARKLTRKE